MSDSNTTPLMGGINLGALKNAFTSHTATKAG